MIAWIQNLPRMKWSAREDTPDSHLKKAGTPSMGGLGIVGSALFCVLGMASLHTFFTLRGDTILGSVRPLRWQGAALEFAATGVFLLLVAAFMLLGFKDDWSKARGTGGLRARSKFAWQVVLSALFLGFAYAAVVDIPITGLSLADFQALFSNNTWLSLLQVGLPFLLFLVGTCNAVNLTDGIDGLAAGLTVIAGISLALCDRGVLLDSSWLAVALAGSCLGFLSFNKFPARVFMGDTGSLALGAALGMCAVLSRAVFLLPFIGFIFYVEMFSVIFQVAWFRYTKKKYGEGRRLFRRAPLHHHYELAGWSEWRVVLTFWAINLVTSLIGLVLWHMKFIPRWPNY